MWWTFQYERYQEMKGIVTGLNSTKATLTKVLVVNNLYELESWCTSIIAQTANGTIIHGRNLDFANADNLRKGSYIAKFVDGSKPVFEATMFSGIIGVYTGMKAGAFSISENQRQFNDHNIGLVENLSMVLSGFYQVSWLIR